MADIQALGNALHAILAMEFINPHRHDRLEKASKLLKFHEIQEDSVDLHKVFCNIDALYTNLRDKFQPNAIHLECPVRHTFPHGQTIVGYIDMLLESDNGLIVLDYKANPRSRDKWHEQVTEYSGQLASYREALSASSGYVHSMWLNFVIPGALVEIITPKMSSRYT